MRKLYKITIETDDETTTPRSYLFYRWTIVCL